MALHSVPLIMVIESMDGSVSRMKQLGSDSALVFYFYFFRHSDWTAQFQNPKIFQAKLDFARLRNWAAQVGIPEVTAKKVPAVSVSVWNPYFGLNWKACVMPVIILMS